MIVSRAYGGLALTINVDSGDRDKFFQLLNHLNDAGLKLSDVDATIMIIEGMAQMIKRHEELRAEDGRVQQAFDMLKDEYDRAMAIVEKVSSLGLNYPWFYQNHDTFKALVAEANTLRAAVAQRCNPTPPQEPVSPSITSAVSV